MPVAITLYYDANSGELSKVTESSQFKAESPLMRADVLRDVWYDAGQRYEIARCLCFGQPSGDATGEP